MGGGKLSGQRSYRWEREGLQKGNTWLSFGGQRQSVRDRGRINPVVNTRVKKEEMTKKKKTICPAKNPKKKKNEKSRQHGPHWNRSSSTLETDPRVSL